MDTMPPAERTPKPKKDALQRYRERKRARDRERVKIITEHAQEQYRDDPDAYHYDFCRRKVEAESGPPILGAVIAILINLGWQAIAVVTGSRLDASIIGEDSVVAIWVLLVFVSICIFFLTVFILGLAIQVKRGRKADLMIEECFMQKTGRLL